MGTHPDDVEEEVAGAAPAASTSGGRAGASGAAKAEVKEPLVAVLVVADLDVLEGCQFGLHRLVGRGPRLIVRELDSDLVVLRLGRFLDQSLLGLGIDVLQCFKRAGF